MPKLKAFADDKSNVTQNVIFVLGRVENIVGKVENACYHFLLFTSSKSVFLRVVKSQELCGKALIYLFLYNFEGNRYETQSVKRELMNLLDALY